VARRAKTVTVIIVGNISNLENDAIRREILLLEMYIQNRIFI
jgi:hypothetical protein